MYIKQQLFLSKSGRPSEKEVQSLVKTGVSVNADFGVHQINDLTYSQEEDFSQNIYSTKSSEVLR